MLVFPSCQEVLWKKDFSFRVVAFLLIIVIQKATKESMVRTMGFEPIRQMATDFESASSTDSNISAYQAVLKVA